MTKLYDAITPHMQVVSADGKPVGKVDHEEGVDRIKLTREGPEHKYVNWDWVDRAEAGKLVLNINLHELRKNWERDPSAHIR
jgi:hypothetical protein